MLRVSLKRQTLDTQNKTKTNPITTVIKKKTVLPSDNGRVAFSGLPFCQFQLQAVNLISKKTFVRMGDEVKVHKNWERFKQ